MRSLDEGNLIIPFCLTFQLLARIVKAQASSATASSTPTDSANSPDSHHSSSDPSASYNSTSASATSSANASCDFSDSSIALVDYYLTSLKLTGLIRNYLSCEKNKISTTTLVWAGIGLTVGIFALVFLTVWLVQRGSKKRADIPPSQVEPDRRFEAMRPDASLAGPNPVRNEKAQYRRADEKHKQPQPGGKVALHGPFAARVENASDVEGGRALPSQMATINGSPMDTTLRPRSLYPSNPSPDQRHLNHQQPVRSSLAYPAPAQPSPASVPPLPSTNTRQPKSAMRQSVHSTRSRRESVASVHFGGAGFAADSTTPPPLPPLTTRPVMPAPSDTFGPTPPLAIRKSVAPTVAIPSYYESTGQAGYNDEAGQGGSAARQSPYKHSVYWNSSNHSSIPSLPPYASPPISSSSERGRRPSAVTAGSAGPGSSGTGGRRPSAGRQGSEDRGGMI